ncbi:peptidoglycan DD-metalloendopeptidase family protein [Bacillus swezeyi]|uniref:Peptidase M23 n=1 Tax=Bacillus swezeyi TaxID=1925020 RepID=A0A1R1RYC6_9BACI|nr:M23 family metallopeptidase [Bacillus swezeyi]MEC1259443.1 peptidoglycan DD-metalloendopeptidase family protein [Bacillus swezeyi]MED1740766.1 peptidoglycan DD-metalloendopeptidase family protein [Bacillus swezeyi]MED2927595.1 peptidoglycan DD-metalloendopeptidase family protein [Bacillus swezeyi]MED2962793.1 peptidoglycan DD-metalloendopeptidase family protein [Bacillus swezeyi]MED2977402.1 peptidoglycan DD-metalloendopeptidase family protein [Bacillus swezeyi]
MRKKLMTLGLTAVVGMSAALIPFKSNHALAYEDLEKKKSDVQSKKSENQSKLEKKKQELSELESKEASLKSDIEKIDGQMTDTNEKLEKKKEEIDKTKKSIDELKKQIKELKKKIEKRNKILKDRVRSIQENGGSIQYIDVLLGARSFADFISRAGAVSTIVEADKDLMEEQKRDLQLVEKKETKLSEDLETLEKALKDLEKLKKTLDEQQKEKSKVMEKVKQDKDHAHEALGSLENEAEILKRQSEAIKAEEAHRKKQEAEARRQASSGSSEASSSKPSAPSSSGFIRPASGTFTSGFGKRSLGDHFGVDIAKRGSGVPIYAAAAGTVYNAHYSSSYGNVVFITHNINGQTYQTVYAHMSSLKVRTGQRVEQGKVIGTMGNTGHSYGQHLHFEIHKGLWNNAKSNAVDPANYIPL